MAAVTDSKHGNLFLSMFYLDFVFFYLVSSLGVNFGLD